jgi:hypothetical protein
MPAIASLEDLKAAQKDLLEAKDLNDYASRVKMSLYSFLMSLIPI